jgi:hypothetical protein
MYFYSLHWHQQWIYCITTDNVTQHTRNAAFKRCGSLASHNVNVPRHWANNGYQPYVGVQLYFISMPTWRYVRGSAHVCVFSRLSKHNVLLLNVIIYRTKRSANVEWWKYVHATFTCLQKETVIHDAKQHTLWANAENVSLHQNIMSEVINAELRRSLIDRAQCTTGWRQNNSSILVFITHCRPLEFHRVSSTARVTRRIYTWAAALEKKWIKHLVETTKKRVSFTVSISYTVFGICSKTPIKEVTSLPTITKSNTGMDSTQRQRINIAIRRPLATDRRAIIYCTDCWIRYHPECYVMLC